MIEWRIWHNCLCCASVPWYVLIKWAFFWGELVVSILFEFGDNKDWLDLFCWSSCCNCKCCLFNLAFSDSVNLVDLFSVAASWSSSINSTPSINFLLNANNFNPSWKHSDKFPKCFAHWNAFSSTGIATCSQSSEE